MTDRQDNWCGMNWIRKEKRLALYLRDGLACCYCGASVEDGTQLTLDHVTPHSKGGSNEHTNLVTCCHRCNSARGNRDIFAFTKSVAAYLNHGVTPKQINNHIDTCLRRDLTPFLKQAKQLIAQRGGFSAALKGDN